MIGATGELGEREQGQLQFRGPSATQGYFDNPEKNRELFDGDWLNSGDFAYIAGGDIYVTGRSKDIVIRAGRNIYPAEIEKLLISHPKVTGVVVVGMPDTVMGERACAYVAPKDNETLTLDEVVSFLKEKSIAPYKLPERLELVESIPMVGADQKVDKKVLKQDIMEKLKAEGKI